MKLKKSYIFLLIAGSMIANSIFSQNSPYGVFSRHADIGNVLHKGTVIYNPEDQAYTITGSGTNMWFGVDEFHYLWIPLKGNFIVRANISFFGQGVEAHRKAGWIIRDHLGTSSPHVNAAVHGDGLTSLQYRKAEGVDTQEETVPVRAPGVIQLERKGNTFIMSAAVAGQPFTVVQVQDIELKNEVFAGLYVCSHNPDVSETAVFSNVRIIKPAPENFQPYHDYIGCNLEILDINSRNSRIIFTTPHSIQAPNWTNDNRSLIFNSNGLLYTYNLQDNSISQINSGFADNNNNDHVLSFDGKFLGISHHRDEDNGNSTVYIMPVEGSSTPEMITMGGASYLHGWSPDGTNLLFTGNRNNKYDIYRISVDTKQETRLTDAEGLDDGSEYSPDGKYIYFNSNRTGTMQIWRMNADGSEQVQLTDGSYQDWFPHVSPDNQWIVFLSYPPEVPSGDHPFCKHVLIRLMPVAGGEPEIIGYVYGGQGTMNVPSWSPDSKKIAFVSNTDIN
jgi:Tol biopolymer transport system component